MDPEQLLKGRIAEALVEEMLKKSGNKIYRFGYESILQNLVQGEKSFNIYSDTGKQIRSIPDFILVDKDEEPHFVEVKFRKKGELYHSDPEKLNKINDFWKAKIVLVNCVTKPYFNIAHPPYFNNSNDFLLKPLLSEETWKIDQAVYDEFETLVEKYLKPQIAK